MTDRNDWVQYANCATTDPDLFVRDERKGGTYSEARKICDACTVQAQCLEEALRNNEEYGIWGGTSRGQREQLVRQGAA